MSDLPGMTDVDALADRYVYFLDDAAFEEVAPGMRRRVVVGEHLSVWFWRIESWVGPTEYHSHRDHEQVGFIAAGELEFRIGGGDRRTLGAGSFYLAPVGVPHGESRFRGDPAHGGEVWIVDVFSPPRVGYQDDRAIDREGEGDGNGGGWGDVTAAPDWRLAVDIGGTFTDVVLLDAASGTVVVDKALTTPAAPLDGVRAAMGSVLDRAGVAPASVTRPIVHATTLVTNALIEGRTGRAALVTTEGFGDTLEIRTEHRYDMYDLQIEFPEPPIPRRLVRELAERTTADGRVLATPTEAALDDLAAWLGTEAVEAVAVCLLHGYANPANERLVAEGIEKRTGLPVSTSSEVSPQIREYPRMVTTACNAATIPVLAPYLDELQRWLAAEGFGGGVLMVASNGGVVPAAEAARVPIRLVESGPAAGALAGAWHARRLGVERLLCFDMGGTTAKSCLVEQGEPHLTSEFEVARVYRFTKGSGYPCSVPSVDLVEIGAGGGSIARVDGLGLLKVGPGSAGADPGPASYGRGGVAATTTDADLALGYLDAGWFLGGDMPLDEAAAAAALGAVGVELGGVDVAEVAGGVRDVVDQSMAAASRMHGVERGIDLRGVTVIAFGGAGPVHACGVAELLDAPRVVFPVHASVLSAFGSLVSPVRVDLARSLVRPLDDAVVAARDALLAEMRAEGLRVLAGTPDLRFRYGFDARYVGQGNEITVWVGEGDTWPVDTPTALARFAEEYERVFGLAIPGVGVEVVTWRVAAWSPAPPFTVAAVAAGAGVAAPHRTRAVRWRRGEPASATPVHRRDALGAGAVVTGPAIVEERETTSVIRPGWVAVVGTDGSLVATRSVGDPAPTEPTGAPTSREAGR